MTHELTVTEIKRDFLNVIHEMINDLANREHVPTSALEKLAFEILALVDGEAGDLPPFILTIKPDLDWDIAGNLHHEFFHGVKDA